MIESIFNSLSELLYENTLMTILASLAWGVLSILLSPCHLSSIPLIIGFLGSQGNIRTRRAFVLSLVFAVGILLTIAAIGAITLAAGRLMGDVGAVGNYVVAAVFFVVGLYLLGIIRLPWDGARVKGTKFTGALAAFILGLIFGIGLGPCTFAFMAPVLGVVFEVSPSDPLLAAGLLAAFSVGHCGVIITAGTLTSLVQRYLDWTEGSVAMGYVKKVCGVLVILGGVYFIYTALS